MRTWIRKWCRARQPLRAARLTQACRPGVESLEERCLLSNNFLQTNLVSDIAGIAKTTDPNLVNPWGLAYAPTGPFWVADNNAGVATVYNGQGIPLPPKSPLAVNIPLPNSPTGGTPTGVVFNGGQDFVVQANGLKGPATFIFATEDGTISAWDPKVDLTHAILEVNNSNDPMGNGAVYKGLALGTDPDGRSLIYAANFRAGTIDVFDTNFHPTSLGGSFVDKNVPPGYAPFDIQNINGQLYVTYAQQDAAKHDDVAGAGHGFIDVFDTDGRFIKRLASRGQLNSPWGLALAPADFGDFGNDLLVGNFGNGHINAYDPTTGAFKGTLADGVGNPIVIGGLWGLKFGNGHQAGAANTLFFSAGIGDEGHGLFGSLQAVQPITLEPAAGQDKTFLQTNLVSDVTGIANNVDTNLINPWGLASGPGGPFWVSDNGTAVSTLYNSKGAPQSLVVNIPGPGTSVGHPTGIVFNGTGGFDLTPNDSSTSPFFLFATLEGTIAAWSPAVSFTNAVTVVDHSAMGASYTGLAIGQDVLFGTLLYAANSNGGIDVFDQRFNPVSFGATAFQDPKLPTGFTPYNIQNIGGQLFVTYSPAGATKPGDGFIDVYSTEGKLLRRFASRGPLQSPWGMAVAPTGFGKFSGDLIVGNVDSGRIDAFNLRTGHFDGQLLDGLGRPITISGVWGLEFGTGGKGGDPHTLFFNAGIGDYGDGLFGSLQAIEPVQTT
jgi:uncharacterized protein (TIGR03118 family)